MKGEGNNIVTQEMLEKAKIQTKEYFLEEFFTLGIRMSRDKSQTIKRFFGERNTTVEAEIEKYIEVCLKTGEIPYK